MVIPHSSVWVFAAIGDRILSQHVSSRVILKMMCDDMREGALMQDMGVSLRFRRVAWSRYRRSGVLRGG